MTYEFTASQLVEALNKVERDKLTIWKSRFSLWWTHDEKSLSLAKAMARSRFNAQNHTLEAMKASGIPARFNHLNAEKTLDALPELCDPHGNEVIMLPPTESAAYLYCQLYINPATVPGGMDSIMATHAFNCGIDAFYTYEEVLTTKAVLMGLDNPNTASYVGTSDGENPEDIIFMAAFNSSLHGFA